MKNTAITTKIHTGLLLFGTAGLLTNAYCAGTTSAISGSDAWQKPVWLTDLSLGVKESYDNNVLLVSGNGMQPQASWVSTVSPKIGFNFAPLLGNQNTNTLQTLSLVYSPDFNIYEGASSQSYDAHKIGDTIKGSAGDFSYSLDNAFLYNDGNKQAPIYGPADGGNSLDQYRNNYAHQVARERLAQTQDRAAIVLQYDWDQFFVRPTASLLDYNLMTDWHNTKTSPWIGYQNYVDRYDVNGGVDVGYKLTPKLAATLGYRYGGDYQQRLPVAIVGGTDTHYSSSTYQRVLLGLEGKPWSWLNVKLTGGPDFRSYNSMTPVNDLHPIKYYGEAVLTVTITPSQTVTFNYKQWQWVASTGKAPYLDSTYALAYHWSATKQLGLDLGGKVLESDYTEGNDTSGTAPSLRDDMEFEISAGATYAFTPHLSANVAYTYDLGDNAMNNLPASLGPNYREFEHQVVSLGIQYKF